MTETEQQAVRDKNHIIAEGKDIPPPITNFTVSLCTPVGVSILILDRT
jgi:hypothetical protein